jgi:hypothetical protein
LDLLAVFASGMGAIGYRFKLCTWDSLMLTYSHAPRVLPLVLLAAWALCALPAPAGASDPASTPEQSVPVSSAVQSPSPGFMPAPVAGLKDYIIGNRSRMIQVVTIGFALGIVILVTATRKY